MRALRVCAAGVMVVVSLAGVPAASATTSSVTVSDPLRILLVGDSVTQGSSGDFTWRYRFWRELQRQGVPVDFVGPRSDLYDHIADAHGSDDYADPAFDQDHAARWGAAFPEHLGNGRRRVAPDAFEIPDSPIGRLVATYQPDVIVELLGINDLTWGGVPPDEVQDRLRIFTERARAVDPDVEVVLGKAPQVWADTGTTPAFNTLVDALADELGGTASGIAVAHTDVLTYGADTWDPAHPSATGEVKIAAAVTDAIADLGHAAPAQRPLPVVANGPTSPPHLTLADRDGGTAELTWTLPPGATAGRLWRRVGDKPWEALTGDVPFSTSSAHVAIPPARRTSWRLQPVKGWHGGPASAWSNPVLVDLTPAAHPIRAGRPEHLVLRKKRAGPRFRVRASWSRAPHATRYRVMVRVDGGRWRTASWSTTRRTTLRPRPQGTSLAVRVHAYRGRTAGGSSSIVRIRL